MVSIDCKRYQQDVGPPVSDAGVCHGEPRNLETLLPPNHVSISRDLAGQVGSIGNMRDGHFARLQTDFLYT